MAHLSIIAGLAREFLDALTRATFPIIRGEYGAVHPFVIGEYRSGIARTRRRFVKRKKGQGYGKVI